jgi:ring-1,2-phenylacetyl-CoA epoxidase subunit PaaB
VKSLDPRVNRLPKIGVPGKIEAKASMDQFGTFEVFVQPKTGKAFQHEGNVHAPNLEMAYILAKETFTRRFLCSSLYVVDTGNVYVSPMTFGNSNVYDQIVDITEHHAGAEDFEIYHLTKRGKQHIHAGTVSASSPEDAMSIAKVKLKGDKTIYNIWAIRSGDIRFTSPEEKDLWTTLAEKKFRDAADYKGGDKLKFFLERSKVR